MKKNLNNNINPRIIAIKIISDICENKTSLINLKSDLIKYNSPTKDIANIQNICYGVCRYYYLIEELFRKNFNSKTKPIIKNIIYTSFFQIYYLKKPAFAIINEAVSSTKHFKAQWAGGIVNVVLKNMMNSNIDEKIKKLNAEKKYSFPHWLFMKIRNQYDAKWRYILENSNQLAPMILRINKNLTNTDEYKQILQSNNIKSKIHTIIENCLILDEPVAVKLLPDFENGYCSVQDSSAQFAGHILQLNDNDNVLDCCAAPGGKSFHLLEQNKNINLTAIDNKTNRLEKIKENHNRINSDYNIEILLGDATKSDEYWYKNNFYDVILLDAPCSATGVIRRHPDIKILRTENEIIKITKIQIEILKNLWSTLKENGRLLYATCSILEEENDLIIEEFLKITTDLKIINIDILEKSSDAIKQKLGYQILPNIGDGFYYCMLSKV